jgi:predicted glycosyltransferase
MIVAARLLNIPTAVMIDYEFVQMIPFMNLALIIVPEVVAMNGAARGKTTVAKYPGIKEDVYVPFFKPDGMIKKDLGLEEDKIVVTIRPPATEAHYHNAESEMLFAEVMNMLGPLNNVQIVILPRNEVKQTAWIKANWPAVFANGKAFIPSEVVDGLNLIWHSDLVISGGGTMNREAAALGVPVFSIFRGKIGAVDRYLSQNGRLHLLTSKEEVRRIIKVQKRNRIKETGNAQSAALDAIVNAVAHLIEKK